MSAAADRVTTGPVWRRLEPDRPPVGLDLALGPWTLGQPLPDGDQAPGAAIEPTAAIDRWQVMLPPDLVAAAALLGRAAGQLDTLQNVLPLAEQRLSAFVAVAQHERPGAVSYAVTGAPESAERRLAELLAAVGSATTLASYADRERATERWRQRCERATAQLASLGRELRQLAWVETSRDGQRLAVTVVGWSGAGATVVQAGCAPDSLALHQRAVVVAVITRQLWLAQIASLGRTAALLAGLPALLAVPGGPLLALGAAWSFISQVLAEGTPRPPQGVNQDGGAPPEHGPAASPVASDQEGSR